VNAEASRRTHAVADGARPDERCLQQAEQRGAIARALRRSLPGGLVLNDSKLVESVSR
jgi:hypothetical protein